VSARPATLASPYKGLAAFEDSELDAMLFFGREREAEIIAANLAAYRLTVLYGATGVGKTSLLRAGVAHDLRRRASEGRDPDYAVIVFDRWSGSVVQALVEDTAAELQRTFGDHVARAEGGSLADRLAAWSAALECEVLLILDQAEEYFLYHGRAAAARFADEFGELVTRPGLRANVLVSVRDDALSRLDRFKSRVPNLFANYLRLDHLDRRAARLAIEGPVERYNSLNPDGAVELEPTLVEAVLHQTVAGRVELSHTGRGGTEQTAAEGRVEAPYLQLVMRRLWDEESAAGSRVLRLETLERLGGAEEIVRTHLEGALEALNGDERDLAATVFNYLVTPSGTKMAHGVGDLAGYADVDEGELREVISRLEDERIVRPISENGAGDGRYEIFHDVLAEPIVAWRAAHLANRTLERERTDARRRHRRLLAITIASLVALAAMAVVTVFALRQRSEAQSQRTEARRQRSVARSAARQARAEEEAVKAGALVADALSQLETNPDNSLRLSVAAAHVKRSPQAATVLRQVETVLRAALFSTKTLFVLPGGGGAVTEAVYSSNGRLVATAASGGQARVFQTRTGALQYVLQHRGSVHEVAFSPDGRYVATASGDGTASLWNAATGGRVRVLDRHLGAVFGVAFNRSSTELATASGDRRVRIWGVPSGDHLQTIRVPAPVRHVYFSPDGQHLLVVTDESTARVYSRSTGSQELTLPSSAAVTSAAYSASGRFIVTASRDHVARVWDAVRGILREPLPGERLAVTAAAFSPDVTRVVTASLDGEARIFRLGHERAELLTPLTGHTNPVLDAAYSADGNWIVTASADKTARVWNTKGVSTPLRGHKRAVQTAEFSPSGGQVVTASADGTARIWDAGTTYELRALGRHPHGRPATTASFSPDGRHAVSAGADGTARIWRVGRKHAVAVLQHRGGVTAARYSPDGRMIATASNDRTAALWRSRDGSRMHRLRHSGAVLALAFAPDSRFLVTGAADHRVRVWNARTGRLVHRAGLPAAVSAIAYSPKGDRAVAAARDGSLALIAMPRGAVVRRRRADRRAIVAVAFSPDGRRFATASADWTAKIWSAATGRLERTLAGHNAALTSVAFSPDGTRVVTGSGDHDAIVWDAMSGKRVHVLAGHFGPVRDVSFSADGRWIVTAGPAAAGLWSARSGQPVLFARTSSGPLNVASFSPNGRWVVTADAHGYVREYDCRICGRLPVLLRLARAKLRALRGGGRR
jgi:WD40 repeat protein